jgi:ABC-type bacteriocin/lantibiotic exporter with double-glycine peptidase domain
MFRHLPQRLALLVCLCGVLTAALASSSGIWLDVPFVSQEKNGCGAAVISMVLRYWHSQTDSSPQSIQHSLYSRKAHGIFASDLQRYFQEHGFRAFSFAGRWDDLRDHLEKGRPLIVALKPAALESELHYVVVVGIEPKENVVLVNDPAQRKLLKRDRVQFERQWAAIGNWTLLAVPDTGTAH